MAYVPVSPELPGIVGLFAFRPETALPLSQLAETLLRGPSPLSSGERELIASFVSARNETPFCQLSHGAAAIAHLGDRPRIEAVWSAGPSAEADPRMRALLTIAEAVTRSPQGVKPEMVEAARAAGADDVSIHDTVLIASAFCMYNRYVDGLATFTPTTLEAFGETGERLAHQGYIAAMPREATRA